MADGEAQRAGGIEHVAGCRVIHRVARPGGHLGVVHAEVRCGLCVCARSPLRPMNDGSNACVLFAQDGWRVALRVDGDEHRQKRSPCLPSRRFTSAAARQRGGANIGHCVKPKKTSTALPRKSATVRSLPSGAFKRKSCPYGAPVMSIAWKRASAHYCDRSRRATTRNSTEMTGSDNARQRFCGKTYRHTTTTDQSAAFLGARNRSTNNAGESPVSYRMGLPGATP